MGPWWEVWVMVVEPVAERKIGCEVSPAVVAWWVVCCTQEIAEAGLQEEWCTWCGSSGDPAVVPSNCQGCFGIPWVVVVVEVAQWPSSTVHVHWYHGQPDGCESQAGYDKSWVVGELEVCQVVVCDDWYVDCDRPALVGADVDPKVLAIVP